MKTIKLLKNWISHKKGEIMQVESSLAEQLIRSNFAKEVLKRGPKPKGTKILSVNQAKYAGCGDNAEE